MKKHTVKVQVTFQTEAKAESKQEARDKARADAKMMGYPNASTYAFSEGKKLPYDNLQNYQLA